MTFLVLLSSWIDDDSGDPKESIASTTVARCSIVQAGPGPADWRATSIPAGPVGIRKRPLRTMEKQPDGTFATKMPVLIDGHDKVTVAAVPAMRGRVRLFYGGEATSFDDDTGFERIRFHPCRDRDRTVWPGGIEVRGRGAVRLKVTVAGQKPFVIGLGRPTETRSPDPPRDSGDGE